MKLRLIDKQAAFTLSILLSLIANAQNPIISQRYTADPTGLEYNGRLYVWASHDIDGQKRYWMNDITCLSTDDMQNWTDHGEVFKAPDDMPWVTQAWAPSVVEKNGEFYMYTGDGNRSVNVSVSDSPIGPFKGVGGKPLITKETPNADVEWLFDPTVFIDTDGQAYCVFGGGPTKIQADGKRRKNARIIKLGDDLVSTVGEAVLIDAPGFYEGGYINKRTVNGITKYYFSYFTNIGTGMNIDYMMSDSPMTGWEYKGTVLQQPKDNYNNSHASVFSFKDKWYLGYHTRKIATDRNVDPKIALRQRSV
ncbi:family 43 glycosylhydrolase [Mariniflexile sp.]|uniref:family 43 glycosylhydrolase n=2 Tax=Mariniflexile sp. TaxID=1979402 RepID=UPI0040470A09